MPVSGGELHEIFAAGFPARSELASLEYVETIANEEGTWLVVRLIIWDRGPDGALMIRDVKEQQVWFDTAGSSASRIATYVEAFKYVASRALARPEVETLMPHDLLISNVLKLEKPQTVEQFVKALSVKSRLGKYLP